MPPFCFWVGVWVTVVNSTPHFLYLQIPLVIELINTFMWTFHIQNLMQNKLDDKITTTESKRSDEKELRRWFRTAKPA